jgi:hypothetical protein
MNFDDNILKKIYVEHDIPVDTLVREPNLISRFAKEYAKRSRQKNIDKSEIGRHLKNLGRRGQDRGGLPRLRRK